MRKSPCKDCPKCIRQIFINVLGRSCHSELCPYDYLQWKEEVVTNKEMIREAQRGEFEEAMVSKRRVLAAAKRNNKR